MKSIIKNKWALAMGVFLLATTVSCKQNADLVYFNQGKSYIYFGLPNPAYAPVEKYIDSMQYSFALDEIGTMHKRLAIPVRISGIAANTDRHFKMVVDEAASKYDKSLVTISDPVIHANKTVDTIYIDITNGEILRDTVMQLKLKLAEDSQFSIGHKSNESIKIKFTNQLLEPKWWFAWRNQFGTTFYPEVYQQWIRIYAKNVDPTPDIYNAADTYYYYWDNMPTSATQSWYPVTFMYVTVLKKYFEDNIVYPNGDNTLPRILLP